MTAAINSVKDCPTWLGNATSAQAALLVAVKAGVPGCERPIPGVPGCELRAAESPPDIPGVPGCERSVVGVFGSSSKAGMVFLVAPRSRSAAGLHIAPVDSFVLIPERLTKSSRSFKGATYLYTYRSPRPQHPAHFPIDSPVA